MGAWPQSLSPPHDAASDATCSGAFPACAGAQPPLSLQTQPSCLCRPWETMHGLLPTPQSRLYDFTIAVFPIPMTKPCGLSGMMNVPALCEGKEKDIC